MFFSLCLIALISTFQVRCTFFMVLLILEVLCKPIISYFTPIFLTLISYIFELKIYILHQSALGSLHMQNSDFLMTRLI